jgi:selenophosphate synthetase-related protein
MAGVIGTALMLAEASGIGITIDPARIPRPPGAALERWLMSFPSFGFLLAVKPEDADTIIDAFHQREIACAAIGECETGTRLSLRSQGQTATVWDLAEAPLTGCKA